MTDQPQWMKDVAAAHAARRRPQKAAADQPTPPPSLEEARTLEYEREIRMDRYAREWIQAAREDPERRTDVTGEMLLRIIRLERAAARAEVIREVEAALTEQFGVGHTEDHMRCEGVEFDPTHCSLCRVVVRALSQGGEGKSDG